MRGNYYLAGVLAAVGAVLLVLAISWVGTTPADETMEYGDCLEITPESGIIGASGALETVTINGKAYVRAAELGEGKILYEGKKTSVRVVPAEAVMMILDGQSNAEYLYPEPDKAVEPEPGQGYYWGWSSGAPATLSDDLRGCRIYDMVGPNGVRIGNKGPAMAATYSEITGEKVLFVYLGIGGAMVRQFDPDTGNVWARNVQIMELVNQAVEDMQELTITKTVLIWAQGEWDYTYGNDAAAYGQQFKRFYDGVQAGGLGRTIDEWYYSGGRSVNVGWVTEELDSLGRELKMARAVGPEILDSFTMANGLMKPDDIHYTQEGCNAWGTAAARAIAKAQGYSLGRAPYFLAESQIPCDLNDSVELPAMATGYDVDGGRMAIAVSWDGAADTSAYGVTTVAGEVSDPSIMVPHAVGALAVVKTGYVGWVGDIEYIKNSATTLAVMNHDWHLEQAVIPGTVDGMDVTQVLRQAFHHVPYSELSIPDTVTVLEQYALFGFARVESVSIGDGLEEIKSEGLTGMRFYKNGTEVTKAMYRSDPTLIHGDWEWNGATVGVVYYVEEEEP